MSYGIIYLVTNTVNGKVYVGQSMQSLRQRRNSHLGSRGSRAPTYFERALAKHGRDSFAWTILDTAEDQDELNRKERYWIETYGSTDRRRGYNTNPGGLSYGHMPDGVRAKISQTRMGYPGTMNGRKHTPEAREKIRQSKLGKKRKPFTAEAIANMVAVKAGKPLSPEHRAKIAAANSGKPKTYAERPVMNLTTGEVFPSVTMAARKHGIFGTSICACCRGKARRVGGHRWAYVTQPRLPLLSP